MPPDAPLDPALARLLSDRRVHLRPPSSRADLDEWRAMANRFLASATRPELPLVENRIIDGPGGALAIREYTPTRNLPRGTILFAHGGGFVFGGLDSHDALCRRLAIESGGRVAALDYRLAPDAPFPAALLDCLAALDWLCRERPGAPVALAGDSAGAQLALASALTGDHGLRGLALLYPLVDPSRGGASHATFGEGRMLTGEFLDWCWSAYRGDQAVDRDPRFDLRSADLSKLPPSLIVTAGHDPLRDEGLELIERMKAAGVTVAARHYPDMIHGFAALPGGAARAQDAVSAMASHLRDRLSG
ncbi:putative lipase/esterase [Marinicauda pacifica]|uniref:Alpha/beta hydrolase n=1 Tax=Marinicauda pacifica TaxID=1133559 RepID=A0A4S2H987_9PROT|nr:alpha/beta hydrolase [Marinicauda pacifica]TGY92410.1 alpha/beta hydrolase [Marinicauda pacifica]GGE48679.1 putative lipase/esterase [Marinicauda pacifica]